MIKYGLLGLAILLVSAGFVFGEAEFIEYNPFTQALDGTVTTSTVSGVLVATATYSSTSSTSTYANDSDKWDNNQFSDYLDQAVKTGSGPTFKDVTADSITVDTATVNSLLDVDGGATVKSVLYTVATDGSGDYNCDGTDDDVQILAALNAADAVGGGEVKCKAGGYWFTTNGLQFSGDFLILSGEGDATVFYLGNGVDDDMIQIGTDDGTEHERITIRDLKLDGRGQDTNESAIYATNLTTNLRIENVTITDIARGIYLRYTQSAVVTGCTFLSIDERDGILSYYGIGHIITDNQMWTVGRYGIIISDTPDCNINSNRIRYCTNDTIYLEGNAGNCMIFDNILTNGSADGIHVANDVSNDRVSIVGNNIRTMSGDGIDIAGANVDDTFVADNVFATITGGNINNSGTDTIRGFNIPIAPYSIKVLSQSGIPTTTDIPTGCFAVWIDTDNSNTYFVTNSTGAIKTYLSD